MKIDGGYFGDLIANACIEPLGVALTQQFAIVRGSKAKTKTTFERKQHHECGITTL